jgi:hypothetical protein
MPAYTLSEKILSAHCGKTARAGDIIICRVADTRRGLRALQRTLVKGRPEDARQPDGV